MLLYAKLVMMHHPSSPEEVASKTISISGTVEAQVVTSEQLVIIATVNLTTYVVLALFSMLEAVEDR